MTMSIDVIQFKAPSVFPGDLTRPTAPFTTETAVGLTGNFPTVFGNPVAIDSATGHVRPIGAGDDTADIFGAVVRVFPTQSASYPNSAIGAGTPSTTEPLTVLRDGYIGVKVLGATAPVKGGAVYVQTVANGALTVGGISAAADSTNNFVWVGAQFTGGVDANGNSEIHFRVQS